MTELMSNTLEICQSKLGRAVCCKKCAHALSRAGEPWKSRARLIERPMAGAGGVTYTTGEKVVLRRFFCPRCGSLLDTETALAGDPYLDDVLFV